MIRVDWDAEVTKEFRDIDLMLAGHTHGMQFGVEVPGFRWSPVQYVYRQWAGLYETEKQKLYVNRGFGFIGYRGEWRCSRRSLSWSLFRTLNT